MDVRTLRIAFLGFDDLNTFDIAGPFEAFSTATRMLAERPRPRASYLLRLHGPRTGALAGESGLSLMATAPYEDAVGADTVIVPGGPGLRQPDTQAAVAQWLRTHARRSRRVVSVCTGLYGLAASGLLKGRRATTHWRFAADAARVFPGIEVDGAALFLRDGRFYSSAGISAAVDLALALIEEDFGRSLSLAVAREMVVYLRREGGQSQYSEPLRFQARARSELGDLIPWIHANLGAPLSVEQLAQRVHLGARQLSRRFRDVLGVSPAAYLAAARLDEARRRLTDGRDSIEVIASGLGYGSGDVLRRRFRARYGLSPVDFRQRFARALPSASSRSRRLS
ncbi:MAG: helix-turn-helix domain-containing protein [Proteobacteria bacterium]|nr:helix-turn-helix domain-containing protein [Pseudomonadota bacterium]